MSTDVPYRRTPAPSKRQPLARTPFKPVTSGAAAWSFARGIRDQLPDGCLVMLRRGAFFEAFTQDAIDAATALGRSYRTVQFADGPAEVFEIPAHQARMLARRIPRETKRQVVLVDGHNRGTLNASKTIYVKGE